MTFQQETLYDVIDEIDALIALHYQEVTLHKDYMQLDVDWPRYRELERQERLLIYTARSAEKLVGYAAFFVDMHIHYKGSKVANNDALFLHPEHRKGSLGMKFISYCDRQLTAFAPLKLTWHVKFSHDFSPILRRLGYVGEETIMGRIARGES